MTNGDETGPKQTALMSPESADGRLNTAPSPGFRDKYLLWPFVLGIGTLVLPTYVLASDPFLALLITYLVVVAALIALCLAPMFGVIGGWRSAVSVAVFPFLIGVAIIYPSVVIPPLVRFGEHLRLFLHEPAYQAKIESLSEPGGLRHHVFDWGGTIAVNVLLIYDETDQMSAPPAERHWEDKEFEKLARKCESRVRQLRGHYYICLQ